MTVDGTTQTAPAAESTRSGNYRYPGAPPFDDSELDRRLFRGRTSEAETVLHSILSSDLFLLYAESGLGKTSLLNAGVLHELRARGHWPIAVRLNDTGKSPVQGIRDQILEAAASDPAIELDIDETDDDPSLWDLLASIEIWRGNELQRLVLILDQFEELFTLGWADGDRQRFITEFGEVVRGHRVGVAGSGDAMAPPDVRFVLVIREDSLGSLEALAADIPKIMRNRFRLGPLDPEQAEAAIREPAKIDDDRLESQRFEYTESAAVEILDFLRTSSDRGTTALAGGVDPSQLQIVCQYVERAIVPGKTAGRPTDAVVQIDASDLGGKSGLDLILSKFYRRTVDALPATDQRAVRNMCELGLINRNGRRLSLELDAIDAEYGVRPETLQALVDGRLLRAEPRVGSVYYELAHDTLVAAIIADRDERQVQRRRRRRIVIAAAAVLILALVVVVGLIAAIQSDPSTPEETQLELGVPRVIRLDASETVVLNVEDPDGGVIEISGLADQQLPLIVEVTSRSGQSELASSANNGGDGGAVSVLLVSPAGSAQATYEVRVSSPGSGPGVFEIVAQEREPLSLDGNAADGEVGGPGDKVVFQVDVSDSPQIIDVVPIGGDGASAPTLDVVLQMVGDETQTVDEHRGVGAERVVLNAPGRYFVVVRGAPLSSGRFSILATPAVQLMSGELDESSLAEDGRASYFEIPGDGARAVIVTPLDDDLDVEVQLIAAGAARRSIDESPGPELVFTDGIDETVILRVQRSEGSEPSGGDFAIEVSTPAERLDADGASGTGTGLAVFDITNSDGALLEFAATPLTDEADDDEQPEDVEQDDDALVFNVFDARRVRVELAMIDRRDGGASLILDRDDSGPFTVVVSSVSPSDDAFSARLDALANPIPSGEPVAASASRPFFVTVNDGDQVEFVAMVDAESGPSLDITWSDVDDESIGGGASTFLPGDSVGLILGCGPAAGDARRIAVDVNLLNVPDRTTDYDVQVRVNRVDETGIDWCGPRSGPSSLIGPTFITLLTRSGGAPEQAHCAVRRWFEGDDGGQAGRDREIELLVRFAAASEVEDQAARQAMIDDIFREFDPFLQGCGVGDFAVAGATVRVDELVEGGSPSDS